MTIAATLAAPAPSDPAPQSMAVVLNQARTTRGRVLPANTVIAIIVVPAVTSWSPPSDCRLVADASYQVGQVIG